ncbi:translesion DNA synthesis-associated protein ImuA [Achromobacter pestifer]|uniref:Translesion DNA synthesis-associated protein ImuA n=1 Tax=Achromobacter pestifer TaxID=1353889 RepID=A0A6S6Z2R5_9BURK|nr:translesion DNA synthesis-associated protein ImuA [Achromobacter pestifer]CAB3647414.1 hypothetical protein LMG3431_02567 [Achromobacter pestifer]
MAEAILLSPEQIHPALWRASQLSRTPGRYLATGYPELSAQLPGGGWPRGQLIDVLVQQPGVGEMRLLQAALADTDARPIMLIQPPHPPQASAWAAWGSDPGRLLWVRAARGADALWAAEQAVRSAAFAAVVLWQDVARGATLRRLQLAAQQSDALFVLMRPLAAASQASAAPLRVALRPVPAAVSVDILKRRGLLCDRPILVPLYPQRRLSEKHHASMDGRAVDAREPGHAVSTLAN